MIEKIVYRLYRKYCREHYNRYIELEIEHRDMERASKTQVHRDEYIKVFDAIKRDNAQMLGVERNRAGEYVIVCRVMVNNNIWIILYGPSYNDVSRHPRIMSGIETDKTSGKDYVHIEDILMIDDNIGNGTICMRYFIEETKKLDVTDIRGILSLVDADHFDRAIHFYRKNGFNVEMDGDNRSGRIRYEFDRK